MSQLVLFEAGGVQFGLDRDRIISIEPMTVGTRPEKGPGLKQRIVHKGQNLDLIDLSNALGRDAATEITADTRLVLMKGSSGLALWADSVGDSLEVHREQLEELPPVFTGHARDCFPKVLRREDQLVLILDAAGLEALEPIEGQPQTDSEASSASAPIKTDQVRQVALEAPSGGRTLETMVLRKLDQIITRHVDRIVAKTMADVLDRHQIKANYYG